MSNSTATAVAKINNVNIVVIENGEQRIAVKPICEALGINFSSQLQKLKSDPILSSTVVLSATVGADEKDREMVTIPFKLVFGWLFRIDSRNVGEGAKESVEKYQMECYNALYDHFSGVSDFVKKRELALAKITAEEEAAKNQLRIAKDVLRAKQETKYRVSNVTYQEYIKNGMQLSLDLLFDGGTDD